jgi:hypothetical protein
MDYNKRSNYKLPSYAEIFEQPVITDFCPRFAAAIAKFVQEQVHHYFSHLEVLVQKAEKIWALQGDTLTCLKDLLAEIEEVAHRAFITVCMQREINWYGSVVIRDMADKYIDEYEDEEGPYVSIVYDIASDLPLIKWSRRLNGRGRIIKADALNALKDHLYDIWRECGIQKREIKRLIKYGH